MHKPTGTCVLLLPVQSARSEINVNYNSPQLCLSASNIDQNQIV